MFGSILLTSLFHLTTGEKSKATSEISVKIIIGDIVLLHFSFSSYVLMASNSISNEFRWSAVPSIIDEASEEFLYL